MASQAGDEKRLGELGYVQELDRNWSLLHNFGVFLENGMHRLKLTQCLRRLLFDHCKQSIAVSSSIAKPIKSVITGITTFVDPESALYAPWLIAGIDYSSMAWSLADPGSCPLGGSLYHSSVRTMKSLFSTLVDLDSYVRCIKYGRSSIGYSNQWWLVFLLK